MTAHEVLELNQRLATWTERYSRELGKDVAHWKRKHAINRTEDLARSFADLDEEARLLQIGFVGRVKAGKSSLLNALVFDGETILPRAATPMTAALTTLTYAETFSAEVQFYSSEDLNDIRANAERYEERHAEECTKTAAQFRARHQGYEPLIEDEIFWQRVSKAATRAVQVDPVLAAAHDQWERIRKSDLNAANCASQHRLEANDMVALAMQLRNFVSAEGQFTPLTRSVDLHLPIDALRDVRIIDTPGFNDPVLSREERTSRLLKDCDVVFIASPAGQFLSEQDLDLMSRITQKEGVQELVLVATQVDSQLYGNDTRQPTLRAALEGVCQSLSQHMIDTLQRLKDRHPEIGSTFDDLIQGGSAKIVHTSAMCHSLDTRWDQRHNWDSAELKAWENLQEHYPDFFRPDDSNISRENLSLLANTEELKAKLARARAQKEEIIDRRRTDLVKTKRASLEAFRSDLLEFSRRRIRELQDTDLDELKAQRRRLDSLVEIAQNDLDNLVDESASQLRQDLFKTLRADLKSAYGEAQGEFKAATTEKQKSDTRVRDSMLAKFAYWVWGGGLEPYTYTEFKLYPTPIRAGLEAFADGLGSTLGNSSRALIRTFRTQLEKDVAAIARRDLTDDIDASLIIRSIRGLVAELRIPEFELDANAVRKLEFTSPSLLDDAGRQFLEDANGALQDLKRQAERQIRGFAQDAPDSLPRTLARDLFQDMRLRIQQLEEEVSNLLLTLDRLHRMATELAAA